MGNGPEHFKIEHPSEEKLIESKAKTVADEIIAFAKEKTGLPCPTPEATAWGKFSKQEQEHEGTLPLSLEIARRAREIGGETLEDALKIVKPAYDISKRTESAPDFDPLGINKK